MKFNIQIKTKSNKNSVVQKDSHNFIIYTTAIPTENKANKKAVDLISDHLKIPKSRIRIVSGFKSKNKIIETL